MAATERLLKHAPFRRFFTDRQTYWNLICTTVPNLDLSEWGWNFFTQVKWAPHTRIGEKETVAFAPRPVQYKQNF